MTGLRRLTAILHYDALGNQDYEIGQRGFTGVAELATLSMDFGAIRLTTCTARAGFVRQTGDTG